MSVKEKLLCAHQSLYTAIVIGNAFHVGGILPVGDALFVQGAAAQDKSCVWTHKRCIQNVFVIHLFLKIPVVI